MEEISPRSISLPNLSTGSPCFPGIKKPKISSIFKRQKLSSIKIITGWGKSSNASLSICPSSLSKKKECLPAFLTPLNFFLSDLWERVKLPWLNQLSKRSGENSCGSLLVVYLRHWICAASQKQLRNP